MTFSELRAGARVFVDTNIFIYHFGGQSNECKTLLDLCANGEIEGHTGTFVLAEALHRLMIAEAIQKDLVSTRDVVKKLAEHPEIVKQLSRYNENIKQIDEINILVASLTPEIIAASESIRKEYGLLTNDSLVIATMNSLGISDLISADEGFENIPNIQVFKPRDL